MKIVIPSKVPIMYEGRKVGTAEIDWVGNEPRMVGTIDNEYIGTLALNNMVGDFSIHMKQLRDIPAIGTPL